MKICKDCKYYLESQNGTIYDKCERYPDKIDDVIRGDVLKPVHYCETERGYDRLASFLWKYCGVNGKYWEPK